MYALSPSTLKTSRPRSTIEAVPSHRCSDRVLVFYINRDVDEDRRQAIEAEIENARFACERICAVEGLKVPPALQRMFFERGKLGSDLYPGEVGCYASHLMAHRTIVERQLPYALVLEDDAILADDCAEVVQKVLAALPTGWDIVHLSGIPTRAYKMVAELRPAGAIVRYSRVPSGTVGYLISKQGARKFLAAKMRRWPIDTDFRRPWVFGLDIYGMVPPIITHRENGAPSPIILMGGRARRRRGLRLPSRSAWTGNPLHCPEGLLFNVIRLGPVFWFQCWVHNFLKKTRGKPKLASRSPLHWA